MEMNIVLTLIIMDIKLLLRLMKAGMIVAEGERIRLTNQGIDYGNYVFSRFV